MRCGQPEGMIAKRLPELGTEAQVAGETKLVTVLEHAPGDPAVLEEGPALAAEVLQQPALVAVRDLQMARLDLRRVDPDVAISPAADDAGQSITSTGIPRPSRPRPSSMR